MDRPSVGRLLCSLENISVPQTKVFLFGGHLVEDFVSDVRFEKYVADPSALESFISAVVRGKTVAEFAENATSHIVVAVYGAYSRRREHSAEPRTFFNNKTLGPAACSLNPGCDAAHSSTDNKHPGGLESL